MRKHRAFRRYGLLGKNSHCRVLLKPGTPLGDLSFFTLNQLFHDSTTPYLPSPPQESVSSNAMIKTNFSGLTLLISTDKKIPTQPNKARCLHHHTYEARKMTGTRRRQLWQPLRGKYKGNTHWNSTKYNRQTYFTTRIQESYDSQGWQGWWPVPL